MAALDSGLGTRDSGLAPRSLKLSILNAENAEYTDLKLAWQQYQDFYVGGDVLKKKAATYLHKRQREPGEMFAERVGRVFYENYLGAIIDWYAQSLFRTEPQIDLPGVGGRGSGASDSYQEFLRNCDRAGTSFLQYLRLAFTGALIYRRHWTLLDFPKVEARPANRRDEDVLGISRPYLLAFTPLDILDWRADQDGNLLWAKIRTQQNFRENPWDRRTRKRQTWTIYTRQAFYRYERTVDVQEDQGPGKEDRDVPLLDSGPHALSAAGRVPLLKMEVPDGLWLANRAGSLAVEHFNKSNALSWGIHMGLFAMPIIYSDREWSQVVGESYYLQLGPGDKFEWTEPKGAVFEIAFKNLERLKDEIYRVCYLMIQAQTHQGRNIAQSGVSKQRDYQVVHEVLRGYGTVVRDFIRRVLECCLMARQEEAQGLEIRGFDNFDIRDLTQDIQDALEIKLLVRDSPTFLKETQKRLALKYLDDSEPPVKQQITREIDAAPARQAESEGGDVTIQERALLRI